MQGQGVLQCSSLSFLQVLNNSKVNDNSNDNLNGNADDMSDIRLFLFMDGIYSVPLGFISCSFCELIPL